MLINEVTHIVGLSTKTIRYYEQNGLLKPIRNQANSYRIYDDSDIEKLKKIKFLRELDVSIKDLKLLNSNKLTLEECLQDRLKKIEEEERNYSKVRNMCTEIIKTNATFEDIDINKYLQEINRLGKEGFSVKKTNTHHKEKIWGAILSSIVTSFIFIILIAIITYSQIIDNDTMPWIAYTLFMVILTFPVISILYNLYARIKEIKGGEEDEASKY